MTTQRGPVTGATVGLVVWVLLVTAACAVPLLTDWDVRTALDPELPVPPLHAEWRPRVTAGSVVPVVLAVAGVVWAVPLAGRLRWGPLLAAVYASGLGWMLALALVDGAEGIDTLGRDSEYLPTARTVEDVGAMLGEYVERIPLDHPDNWPIHVAGHPPGAVLVYVALVRLGLGGTLTAGVLTVAAGASAAVAVLVALRRLGAEDAARRAAPFLALTPAALSMAVSADALFTAVAAWGLALLAASATAPSWRWTAAWGVPAGLLLGYAVLLSYGLLLLGTLAVAVLVAARSWRPLSVAAASALAVVLVFAAAGFAWWEALPVLRDRYWEGLARERPASYWLWGNLGALAVAAGPALGAGLGALAALRRRTGRAVACLVLGAVSAVALADLSLMSKAEVERIWLPFVPWLLVSTALLPDRWRRPLLAAQVVLALLVQHLLLTHW
jgi:hypothetical protein